MELTPEERQRIYAQEKARLEAQDHIKSEKSQKRVGCFVTGCLALVGLLAVLWVIGSLVDSKPTPGSDKLGAFLASQDFVKRELRAPSTAKFSDFDEARVSSTGGDSYTVAGWVDAQNGFGAMIRNDFVCKLHKVGDTWYRDDVSLLSR